MSLTLRPSCQTKDRSTHDAEKHLTLGRNRAQSVFRQGVWLRTTKASTRGRWGTPRISSRGNASSRARQGCLPALKATSVILPAAKNYFAAGIEPDAFRPLHMEVTKKRLSPQHSRPPCRSGCHGQTAESD